MAKPRRTGVIREYDMHTTPVRIGYGFVLFLCAVMVVVALFPLVWVILAGFKDLKEFIASESIIPASFSAEPFTTTWSQLGIAKNYLNSLISVAGSVGCLHGFLLLGFRQVFRILVKPLCRLFHYCLLRYYCRLTILRRERHVYHPVCSVF